MVFGASFIIRHGLLSATSYATDVFTHRFAGMQKSRMQDHLLTFGS